MIVVRSGWWLYDGLVELPVDVVGLTYDHGFAVAEADGELDPGEQPAELGADGLLYYVRFRRARDSSWPTAFEAGGFADVDEAMRRAERIAPTPIRWE